MDEGTKEVYSDPSILYSTCKETANLRFFLLLFPRVPLHNYHRLNENKENIKKRGRQQRQ